MQGSNSHQIQSDISFSTDHASARLRLSLVRSHNSYQIIIIFFPSNLLPFRGTSYGCCIVRTSEERSLRNFQGSLCTGIYN